MVRSLLITMATTALCPTQYRRLKNIAKESIPLFQDPRMMPAIELHQSTNKLIDQLAALNETLQRAFLKGTTLQQFKTAFLPSELMLLRISLFIETIKENGLRVPENWLNTFTALQS